MKTAVDAFAYRVYTRHRCALSIFVWGGYVLCYQYMQVWRRYLLLLFLDA